MSARAKRYAQVLMQGLGDASADKVLSDLESFGQWVAGVPALRGAVENPGIPSSLKESFLKDLCKKAGFEPVSERFVQMVVANRRLREWGDLADAFRGLVDEKHGVVRARVRTARPMKDVTRTDLAARLGRVLGRRVELEPGVSPALLGGVELRLGSTVYDGTVAGALKALRQDLVKG